MVNPISPLTFQNLAGGLGTNGVSVGYWASGTVTSVHGTQTSGVGVHATWNPGDILERSADTTTGSGGSFNAQTYVGLSIPVTWDFSMHLHWHFHKHSNSREEGFRQTGFWIMDC
jgi:hypothetical protein